MTRPLFAFDWNGTLLADAHHTHTATNALLVALGFAPISFAAYQAAYAIPLAQFYANLGLPFGPDHPQWHAASEIFYTNYAKAAAKARLRPGARALLQQIKNAGGSAIIVSNHLVPDITATLQRLGIYHLIDAVLAYPSQAEHFVGPNKQARLLRYMLEAEHPPAATVIIGDTVEEVEIAHALGLTAVALIHGHASRARLAAARPHYLLGQLGEIYPQLTAANWLAVPPTRAAMPRLEARS